MKVPEIIETTKSFTAEFESGYLVKLSQFKDDGIRTSVSIYDDNGLRFHCNTDEKPLNEETCIEYLNFVLNELPDFIKNIKEG